MAALIEQLRALAPQEGVNATPLEGVRVFKASASKPREPLCYSQGIIIVAQGTKRVYLHDRVYEYNPNNYLVLTLPTPAECETVVVPGQPLLSLVIDIDLNLLHQLVRVFEAHRRLPPAVDHPSANRSLYVSPACGELAAAVLRLARGLRSPFEAEVLGEGLKREVLYRILCGEGAESLFALVRHNTHLARLERVLKHMHQHFDQPLEVEQLAALANMSPPAFHRNFRQTTATSPIQYIKRIRLTRARELLLDQGLKVKQAAAQVGYESPTQFSREFKRYFGQTPQACSGGGPR